MFDQPVWTQLEKILASSLFTRSARLSRFLRFIVEQTLHGKGDSLKEYVLGLEVFDKEQSFDPRIDPIVRVQARRLRAALTEYYANDGKDDAVVIELPRGGYVPSFGARQPSEFIARPVRGSRNAWFGAGAALIAGGFLAYWLLQTPGPPGERINSIAVLPFADLSPENDQQYFCDGLSDQIIDALTKVEGLRVVARTSSFQFRGKSASIRQIGAQLRVGALLEGSVLKSGNRLRINAQLIRVADGYHVSSQTFERDMTDLFAIQDEISQTVAKTLNVHMPLMMDRTESVEAYNLYLQGRYFWSQWTPQSVQKSIGYYEQAIAKDPNYALAYAGLADAYQVLNLWGGGKAAMVKGYDAITKALQLDPKLPEPHVALAMRRAFYDWDWSGAEREFRRAFELNPRSAVARFSFANILGPQARFQEAEAELQKALELDPLSTRFRFQACVLNYEWRRYDRAIGACEKVLELDSTFHLARAFQGLIYTEKGDYAKAVSEIETVKASLPDDPRILAFLGHSYGRAGHREKALATLAEMKRLNRRRPFPVLFFAFIHTALGEKNRAIELLEESFDARETRLNDLNVSPLWDILRAELRFQTLLKRLGFTT
jgi:TolB-like protein/Flp pilus assembly protein TadD